MTTETLELEAKHVGFKQRFHPWLIGAIGRHEQSPKLWLATPPTVSDLGEATWNHHLWMCVYIYIYTHYILLNIVYIYIYTA